MLTGLPGAVCLPPPLGSGAYVVRPNGRTFYPKADGSIAVDDHGTLVLKDMTLLFPDGSRIYPDGHILSASPASPQVGGHLLLRLGWHRSTDEMTGWV